MRMIRILAVLSAVVLGGCPGKTTKDTGAVTATDDTGTNDGDADTDADADADADADDSGADTAGPWGVRIQDIQEGLVAVGDTVTLDGVIVTSAVTPANNGFFIADPAGGPSSGLWVYISSNPDVVVEPGQVLSITGEVGEYGPGASEDTGAPELDDTQTQTQIRIDGVESYSVIGTADLPSPSILDASVLADLNAAEPYEGVVVRIEGASVTSPFGTGEFVLNGTATVGEMFIEHDEVRQGDFYGAVQGPLYFQDGILKVEPRDSADLEGHTTSCSSCTADQCIDSLGVGDLVISEIMYNPAACDPLDHGEYLEVYNNTPGSVDLNCLGISDAAAHVGYVEVPVVIESGGYAYLERRSDSVCYMDIVAGMGIPFADYRSAVVLNNDEETVNLFFGETVLDEVQYDNSSAGGWPDLEGTSLALDLSVVTGDFGAFENDDASNWCLSVAEIGSTGDYGSPGLPNSACF